jgi:hypothetical protein
MPFLSNWPLLNRLALAPFWRSLISCRILFSVFMELTIHSQLSLTTSTQSQMKMTSEFYSAAATSKAKASVLARLRSETQLEHDAIEEVLDLMSDSLTPDAYRRILARF